MAAALLFLNVFFFCKNQLHVRFSENYLSVFNPAGLFDGETGGFKLS